MLSNGYINMFGLFHLAGVDAFHHGEYQNAKVLLLQAIAENTEASDSYFFLGKTCFLCEENDEAIVYLKQYIDLSKDNIDEVANISNAFDVLGQCYEANNSGDEAIECYTSATKIYPACASAWNNMGLLYIKSALHYIEQEPLTISRDFFNTAKLFIIKALKISGDNPMFLKSVASWYEQYIELLEKSTEDEEAVQKNITNNFDYATQYYRKALAICYENDIGLRNIIISNLTTCFAKYGDYLYSNENYINAREVYLEAVKLSSDHLNAITQVGMCLFKQNDFVGSRKYFFEIFEKTDDKQEISDAWLNIACTYRLEKDWLNAENALNKAKIFAEEPDDPYIVKEEQKLVESKSRSMLVSALQTLFSNNTPTSDVINSTQSLAQLEF